MDIRRGILVLLLPLLLQSCSDSQIRIRVSQETFNYGSVISANLINSSKEGVWVQTTVERYTGNEWKEIPLLIPEPNLERAIPVTKLKMLIESKDSVTFDYPTQYINKGTLGSSDRFRIRCDYGEDTEKEHVTYSREFRITL